MAELSTSWEEKLRETEQVLSQHQKLLDDHGASVQVRISGRTHKNFVAFLMDLFIYLFIYFLLISLSRATVSARFASSQSCRILLVSATTLLPLKSPSTLSRKD